MAPRPGLARHWNCSKAGVFCRSIIQRNEETDELFYVIEGQMSTHFVDSTVFLKKGELFVVPKGVEHMPSAEEECLIMLIEPRGIKNTGNKDADLTAENDIWI